MCKTINIELDMKKTFLAIGIGVCAMTTLMSCDVVEAVASAYAAVLVQGISGARCTGSHAPGLPYGGGGHFHDCGVAGRGIA